MFETKALRSLTCRRSRAAWNQALTSVVGALSEGDFAASYSRVTSCWGGVVSFYLGGEGLGSSCLEDMVIRVESCQPS